MMLGSASGVFNAALWKRTILPEETLEVTREVMSAAERSCQSRLSRSHIDERRNVSSPLIYISPTVPLVDDSSHQGNVPVDPDAQGHWAHSWSAVESPPLFSLDLLAGR